MHKYILVVLGMNYSKLSSNLKITHIGHTLQSSKVMRYYIWSGGSKCYKSKIATVRIFYLAPPLVNKLLIEGVQDKISVLYLLYALV